MNTPTDIEWTFPESDLRTALIRSMAVLWGEDAAKRSAAHMLRDVTAPPLEDPPDWVLPDPEYLSDAEADRAAGYHYYEGP